MGSQLMLHGYNQKYTNKITKKVIHEKKQSAGKDVQEAWVSFKTNT